jgi:hypothetical protein
MILPVTLVTATGIPASWPIPTHRRSERVYGKASPHISYPKHPTRILSTASTTVFPTRCTVLWLLLVIENPLRAHSYQWYWDERCDKLHAGHFKASGCSQLLRVMVEKRADFLYRADLQNLAPQPERGWCGVLAPQENGDTANKVFIATNSSESSNSVSMSGASPRLPFLRSQTAHLYDGSVVPIFLQAAVPAHNGPYVLFLCLANCSYPERQEPTMRRWESVGERACGGFRRASSCILRPIYGTGLSLMHWAGCEDAGWPPGRKNGATMPFCPCLNVLDLSRCCQLLFQRHVSQV